MHLKIILALSSLGPAVSRFSRDVQNFRMSPLSFEESDAVYPIYGFPEILK